MTKKKKGNAAKTGGGEERSSRTPPSAVGINLDGANGGATGESKASIGFVPPANKIEGQAKERARGEEKPEEKPRAWRELFGENRDTEQGFSLDPRESEGEMVELSPDDTAAQNREWGTSLVISTPGQTLPFQVMRDYLLKIWSFVSEPQIFLHEAGYFLVKFATLEDKIRVVEKGPYTYFAKPLFLKDWVPNFSFKPGDFDMVPVWVRLLNLPLNFWSQSALSKIASRIGTPKSTDKMTAKGQRISFARVLVEVNVRKKLIERIKIKCPDTGCIIDQEVYYEWKPLLCSKCEHWGHLVDDCKVKQKTEWVAVGKKTEGKEKEVVKEQNKEKVGAEGPNNDWISARKKGMEKATVEGGVLHDSGQSTSQRLNKEEEQGRNKNPPKKPG